MLLKLGNQILEKEDREAIKKWKTLPFEEYFFNMGVHFPRVKRVCSFKLKDGYEITDFSYRPNLIKNIEFNTKTNILSFIHRVDTIPQSIENRMSYEEDTYVYSIGLDVFVNGFKEPIQLEAFVQVRRFTNLYSDYGKQLIRI